MPVKRVKKQAKTRVDPKLDEEIEAMLARLGAGVGTKARAKLDAKSSRKFEKLMARVDARGGSLEVFDEEHERMIRKREAKEAKAAAKAPAGVVPSALYASPARSTRPAPAPAQLPAVEEPATPKRKRRRRAPGLVGYVDPRLIDSDEWDD